MAGAPFEAAPISDMPSTQQQILERRTPTTSLSVPNDAGLQEAGLAVEISEDSTALNRQSDRHLQGWRAGVSGATFLVFAVLLLNISFLIWALTTHALSDGVATLQQGSCQTSANLNTWIHFVINVLSTAMLSGSNYCMQRLSAPTREEVDNAHRRHKWVDIGVPSFRNLFFISRWRTLGWLVLAASSLPLHLFYNSAVFAQTSATDYSIFIVDPSFTDGAAFNATPLSSSYNAIYYSTALQWLQSHTKNLTTLNTTECISTYAKQIQTERGDVLAVTQPATNAASNSLYGIYDYSTSNSDSYAWLCDDKTESLHPCTAAIASSAQPWKLKGHTISYCLSQPVNATCELQFSSQILVVVIICNLIKCSTMLLILWKANKPPLITLGDCIATYLQEADEITTGMCLLDKQLVSEGQWDSQGIARKWNPRRYYWFTAASIKRWIVGTIISFAGIIYTSVLLSHGISNPIFPGDHSAKSLWGMGFGAVNMATLVQMGNYYKPTLLSSTLLANTPQLILSMLYFTYNPIFTCELVGQEWSNFGRHRQPLRVTRPHGEQKSTYWLNLPYRYGLPLMTGAIFLHWLFSRAIFLVNLQFIDPLQSFKTNVKPFPGDVDQLNNPSFITQCGWSPSAVIISIIAASLVVIVGLLFGLRRYSAGPPLVGSCSAAIAAACHREPDEDKIIVLLPLKWGVTSEKDGVGHCTFSAREVEGPNGRDVYR